MDISFCVWAPWVFSALAGLAGWLLRRWYDDQKFDELRSLIKTKDDDIYHLNEAHTLLQNDKAKRLEEHQIESESKDRQIQNLTESLAQTEASTKSLLSRVVENQKTSAAELALKPLPSAKLEHKKISTDEPQIEVKSKKGKKKRGKNQKRKIRKYKKVIQNLKEENSNLLALSNEGGALAQEVIREIPVTILKTIRVKEKIDRQKLKELIKSLPLIKTKKTISKKRKKGKIKIL